MRKIEIYSAGCHVCNETIEIVKSMACDSCDIEVLDMHDKKIAKNAEILSIQSLPTVVVKGRIVGCCKNRGIDLDSLRKAGIGKSL